VVGLVSWFGRVGLLLLILAGSYFPEGLTPARGQTVANTLIKMICNNPTFTALPIGAGTFCVVYVSDLSAYPSPPTGTVTFSQCCDPTGALLPSSIVRSADVCTLTPPAVPPCWFTQGNPCTLLVSNPYLQERSDCTMSFWPIIGGSQTLAANYSGDSTHYPSSGTLVIQVAKHSTLILVSCSQDIHAHSATCEAVVMDHEIQQSPMVIPTGTISWSSSGHSSFNPPICTLSVTGSTAACTVAFREFSKPSPRQIYASYSGDLAYLASSGIAYFYRSRGGT